MPATDVTEYVAEVNPQVIVGPLITPGVAAVTFNASVLAAPVPQASVAVTDTLPLLKPVFTTIILLVPCPDWIVNPDGTLHV